ncbi:bacterial capsule synthesis protein PGA_cap [Anaerolinea thermolimosa]|uniref:CapA family protein n=1 Tax=Anaerolinea thermolimosa TaxID=229919 RepID=UPI0007818995|nr:CapA family protein [Anaerolinea thermolimosa]GAP05888.1 bacterial capsule synthesis protein PGA_cap [Anaerolinea thermolimosa]
MPVSGDILHPGGSFRRWTGTGVCLLMLFLWCAGCTPPVLPGFSPATPTRTPFRPITLTPTPSPSPTLTPSPSPVPSSTPEILGVWAAPAVPQNLKSRMTLPAPWQWVDHPEEARLRLEPAPVENAPIRWVYVVVAPFPTLTDEISLEDLRKAWRGQFHTPFNERPLWVVETTHQLLEYFWGAPAGDVRVARPDELVDIAWQDRTWSVIPFDELEPRWKALQVDKSSALVRGDLQGYPLVFGFHLTGSAHDLEQFLHDGGNFPSTNRDPSRLTVVLMTGTTALVRATGWRMESIGLDYPARDIRDWLLEPDFTHISNEVSFNPDCPPADPYQASLMFCSRPEYIQLLDAIQPDIIELSGNHNNDWGREAFLYSLELYRQRGWHWFAGGANSNEATRPLIIEHHGNRLAFLGCNLAGPPSAWATETLPGAARCDLEAFAREIRNLREQGILPVMTFQYNEIYVPYPSEAQARDFKAMNAAGAVVVSGSQAHFPQGFALEQGGLIHYGLGNLFFDQMDTPVNGTRREFLDRHLFYEGRYLGVELLTAMLEDYARPRPMTPEERNSFLQEIFSASGW